MKKTLTHLLSSGLLTMIFFMASHVTVKAECHALFGYNQSPNSLLVTFIDSSSSSFEITSWLWHFGDGGVSDNHAPHHSYAAAGTYEVCLTIHDNHDCTSEYCHNVVVQPLNQDCNALFGYYQTPNTLLIHFIDSSSSSHDISTWLWHFGDGSQSDNHAPTHTYATPGTYEVCLTIHDNHDCNDTYCTNIVVAPLNGPDCNAFFLYYQADNSYAIHFIDSSTSAHDITTWHWTFGDGETSDNHAPVHIYDEPGTYQVCLTIHDNHDCNDTYCTEVVVAPINNDDCVANFTYAQAVNSLLVEFTDESTSPHDITSWLWHFGDGGISDSHNPHHTYTEPGTYEVCLTIHDNTGCEDTYCTDIIVEAVGGPDCMALFGYTEGDNPLNIHFIDSSSSSHDIISYLWNFGDGHTGDGHDPHHIYDQGGVYEVCLTIHDNTGCEDTYCQNITVDSVEQGDCAALFVYEQSDGTLTIHFTDESSSSHDITTWLWNFGDGHTSNDHNISHTYAHAGTYEVCLTIHDNHDCNNTYCRDITVDSIEPGDCQALFVYSQGDNSLNIHFIDSSSSEHEIISRLWTFGDGSSGDGHDPHHIYDHAGNYEVCLTIHDNSGCSGTYCETITVDSIGPGDCMALFGYTQGDNSLNIHFIDSSSSSHDIVSYLWNFGDGHTGDGHDPHHIYEHPGQYEVCLTIHDNGDCNDTYCQTITVDSVEQGDCNALFTYYQTENTLTIHFIDSSSSAHDIISWLWNFGDGHVSHDHFISHTYEHAGTYEVCLTIHDNTGCEDTYCTTITVNPVQNGECHASFVFHQVDNSFIVNFTDASSSPDTITSWLWHFGDGGVSDDQNPSHNYEHAGTYEVCLTIHDNHGCTSTYCHHVVVSSGQPECHAAYTTAVDSLGFTVTFTNMSTNTTPNTTYHWEFGDGSTSDDENPVHTYSHHDNFTVCLFIADSTIDCASHICHIVHVHPAGEGHQGDLPFGAHNDKHKKSEPDSHFEHFVSVFPNPFSLTTTIQYELEKDSKVNIELSDLFGNRINQVVNDNEIEGVHKTKIDASNLNPGIYVIRIMIGQDIIIRKITVTR